MQLQKSNSLIEFELSSLQIARFHEREKNAQIECLGSLLVKESLGKSFELANARSMGHHWPKFRESLPDSIYYSSIQDVVNYFANYLIDKNPKVSAHRENPLFIAEVTDFVIRKVTHENLLQNRNIFLTTEAKQNAALIVLLPTMRSMLHEAASRIAKKIGEGVVPSEAIDEHMKDIAATMNAWIQGGMTGNV